MPDSTFTDTYTPELSERPSAIEINLQNLVHNLGVLRAHVANAKVMAILKANAYGHGLIECARALESAKVDAIGVAYLEEGIALRRAGVSLPILALGGISGRQIEGFLEHRIDLTASSVYKLKQINQVAERRGTPARVHLKIDTGMERIGVHYYTAESLLEATLEAEHCEIVGVYSHLAESEGEDHSFAEVQLERFLSCLEFFTKKGLPMPIRHLANSGAIYQLPNTHLDMVRPGLALFGVAPSRSLHGRLDLRSVLSLRSEVSFFKVVRKGATVSYDRTWSAPEDTRVVTVPIGYGDGYLRALSNSGRVLIRGKSYPIIGRVCMDQMMVNLGTEGIGYNGDAVVLIGEDGEEAIRVEEIAALTGADPREVLCSLNARVPRRFHSN